MRDPAALATTAPRSPRYPADDLSLEVFQHDHRPPTTEHRPLTTDLLTTDPLTHSLLLLLLLAALALRFVAVRDLAFPPWVDSSRHALITAVMASTGRAPDGYAPYLPVETFPYHFGFHTLSAGLALLTGWALPGLLLTLGQLLNGLLPLSVYAAGRLFVGRGAACGSHQSLRGQHLGHHLDDG